MDQHIQYKYALNTKQYDRYATVSIRVNIIVFLPTNDSNSCSYDINSSHLQSIIILSI